MIVSFLIPTRGRLQSLLDCIQSIKDKASPDVKLEFLVRIDDDDHETLAGRDRIPGEIVIGPRWLGYDSVYIFVNELATKSHGDWLIPWNDDTFMRTSKWDKSLPLADRAQVVWLRNQRGYTWAFPAMTRKLYELWGCLLPESPGDVCIFQIWQAAGKPILMPRIVVEHRRDDANIRTFAIRSEDKVNPPPNTNKKPDELVTLLRHLR